MEDIDYVRLLWGAPGGLQLGREPRCCRGAITAGTLLHLAAVLTVRSRWLEPHRVPDGSVILYAGFWQYSR